MSTIKSSAENLTLNADGSGNDIILQSNGSNIATVDQAGLVTATTFAGSGASLTALPAAQLTGTLPAISGANLTGLVSTLAGATDATVSASDPVITSNPSAVGHYWVNSSSGETFVCTDATSNLNKWMTNGDGTLIEPFDPWFGARGIIAYGMTGSANAINNIEYITIASPGNATDFGDMTDTRRNGDCASNSTRGVMAGGANISGSTIENIDYITVASTGNAADFGDLHTGVQSHGAATDATTAYFTVSGNMQKLTIATTGSAVNVTDTVPESRNMVSGVNNAARGIVSAGGYQTLNEIFYITWASLGNAALFGNLSGRYATGSFESKTRGVFVGGHTSSPSNIMDYITVATTSNSLDFGDLAEGTEGPGGLTSGTRGVVTPGQETGSYTRVNRLQYVTIATTGNTTDFGDLTSARSHDKGLSGD